MKNLKSTIWTRTSMQQNRVKGLAAAMLLLPLLNCCLQNCSPFGPHLWCQQEAQCAKHHAANNESGKEVRVTATLSPAPAAARSTSRTSNNSMTNNIETLVQKAACGTAGMLQCLLLHSSWRKLLPDMACTYAACSILLHGIICVCCSKHIA
jgi:hypothetical protein